MNVRKEFLALLERELPSRLRWVGHALEQAEDRSLDLTRVEEYLFRRPLQLEIVRKQKMWTGLTRYETYYHHSRHNHLVIIVHAEPEGLAINTVYLSEKRKTKEVN